MENLQQFHVKIVKNFGKALIQGNYKKFIKILLTNLLSNKEFLEFFKKRLRIIIECEDKQPMKMISDKVMHANSVKEIAKILSNLDLKLSQKWFGIIIHSYLQWKNNFNIDKFSPQAFQRSKIKLIKELKRAIDAQGRKVSLYT